MAMNGWATAEKERTMAARHRADTDSMCQVSACRLAQQDEEERGRTEDYQTDDGCHELAEQGPEEDAQTRDKPP